MEDGVVQSLRSRKVDVVIVPGGCTKYIQVPDVFWKKPFKAACSEKYDSWMGEVGIHSETPAGNLKSPPQRIIIQWIVQSWSELPRYLIKKSFPCCALHLPTDGLQDEKIACFREGQPC